MTKKLRKESYKKVQSLQLKQQLQYDDMTDLQRLNIEVTDAGPIHNFLFKMGIEHLKKDFEKCEHLHEDIIKIFITLGELESVEKQQRKMKHVKEAYYQILANNLQLQQTLTLLENENHAGASIFEGKLED